MKQVGKLNKRPSKNIVPDTNPFSRNVPLCQALDGTTFLRIYNKVSAREICRYYGQDYDNIRHMKGFIKQLKNRYKDEK